MLQWKEYPRTIGGLAKYLSWFKEFRRPKDLLAQQDHKEEGAVTLFGKDYDRTKIIINKDFEQGSLGDNYFLTMLAALSEKQGYIPKMFHQGSYVHEGIFAMKVFVKGRPENVTVDDLFPVYGN